MRKKIGLVVLVILMLLLLRLEALAAVDVDKLNLATAKITVRHGRGIEVGSGVVLCQRDGQAYILTARHVLYGDQADPFRKITAIEFEFFKNRWPHIKGQRRSFKTRRAQTKDIALIQVPVGTRSLEVIAVGDSRQAKPLQEVYTTGHPVQSARSWLPRKGTINEIGEMILYTANVSQGYSGGPLVDASGALIGINTQIQQATGIHAIPIDEVVRTIGAWMDIACLQRPAVDNQPTDGGPEKPVSGFSSLQQAIDQYYDLRDSYSANPSVYRSWHEQATRVARQQQSSRSIQDNLNKIGRLLKSAQSGTGIEPVLFQVDYLVEEIENDVGRASIPEQPATAGAMAGLVGSYSLTGYQDATGTQLSPPMINGTMQIQAIGAGGGNILMQVQVPQLFVSVNQTVQGNFNGQIFSGVIMNSNMGNAGSPWNASIGFSGMNMVMTFINGEVWYWVKN